MKRRDQIADVRSPRAEPTHHPRLWFQPHRRVRSTTRLLDDPPRVRTWLRQLLADCDDAFFAEAWSRRHPQLTADARHKTDLLRHKGLPEALASVSSAVTLDEAAGSLLLLPTSLGRPHLMVLHRRHPRYPGTSPS